MKISAHLEDWELTQPFRISGGEWLTSPGLVVQLSEDGFVGRGEAQGVFYLDETAQTIFDQVDASPAKSAGASRAKNCSTCCRPVAPATPWTAPCGTWSAKKPAKPSGN